MLASREIHRRWARSLAMGLLLCSWVSPARAIDASSRAASRKLVNDGVALYQQGRYEEARAKFMGALEVAKVPTVVVWAAQAHERLGKLLAALELYERALLMQPNELWIGQIQQQAQQQAQKSSDSLKDRIPIVRIEVEGSTTADFEVTVDAVTVPHGLLASERPLDPGEHSFSVSRGGRTLEQRVKLELGERRTVSLRLPDAESSTQVTAIPTVPLPVEAIDTPIPASVVSPDRRSDALPYVAWTSLGIGAAALAVGIAGGITVAAKHASLRGDGCSNDTCEGDTFNRRVSSYNNWRTVSTVGFLAGGVGAALGFTLLWVGHRHESAPHAALTLGPGHLQVRGAF